MSGLGNSPIGLTTPFGLGTPDAALAPPTIAPQEARWIDPVAKDYVVGPDGEYLRMPRLRQRVLLALGTILGSSSVQPTAGLKLTDRIDANYERRTQFAVKSALAFLVASGELRVDSVTVTEDRPGRTTTLVAYTDLLTGEPDTVPQ